MKSVLFWLLMGLAFAENSESPKANTSVWLVGKNSISFLSKKAHQQIFDGLKPESTLLDPITCDLWVQSSGQLLKFDKNLNLIKKIPSAEKILADTLLDNVFFTVDRETWTKRDQNGNPIDQFKVPLSSSYGLEGDFESGFWTLELNETTKTLSLVHLSSTGQIIWQTPISEQKEIWGAPQLHWSKTLSQIWVGFSVTSEAHLYSPRIELWSQTGNRLKVLQFPDRGLLLDSCLLNDGHLLISRDLPSSPYTAPLFTHLETLDPNLNLQLLYQAPLNDLIPSIQCENQQVWLAHRPLFESSQSWLGLYSPKEEEKNLLFLKEPAWKMHTCSLE